MLPQKFIANQAGKQSDIEVTRFEGGRYQVRVDDVLHEVDARRFEEGTWSLIIDGQSFDVELEVTSPHESDGDYNVLVRGSVVALNMMDERKSRMGLGTNKLVAEGPQLIVAPMPGKVVKLLVKPDQEVAIGQPIIVVEAMKMENELRAPTAGRVTGIFVKEGATVESKAKLVAIE